MATNKQKKATKIVNEHFKEHGGRFVYLVKCNEFYKIGIASSIGGRIEMLQCGNPYEIDLIMAVKINNALETEKLFHKIFSEKRVRGEWFELSSDEVEKLKDLMCRVE